MIVKIARILLLIITMVMLTGCWSRVEINDVSVVTAVGLDKMENGNIRLSLQFAVPKKLGPASAGGGSGGESTYVASDQGETVMAAYRNLQEKSPRQIFFSHSRIILIGESLAKEGITDVLDFFTRHPESRLNNYIMFTKGQTADLLKVKARLERVSSEEIRELTKQGSLLEVNLRDFTNMLLGEGIEPVAPEFKTEPLEVKKEKSFQGDSQSKEQMYMSVSGTAVFNKDKLIGWMDDVETRGILWFRDEVENGVITVNIPKEKGKGRVSADILRATTRIKPKIGKSQVKMAVNVRAETAIFENDSNLNLKDPKVIEFLQKQFNKEVKKRMQLALDKAQKDFKSDVLGLGRTFYRTHPKEWNKQYKKQWEQLFPELEVTITPSVVVKQTGFTNKSLTGKEKGPKK